MKVPKEWRSLKTRVTLLTSAVLLVGLWSLAFVNSAGELQDLRALLGNQQLSAAETIASQIDLQIEDRFRALEAVARQLTDTVPQGELAVQRYLESLPALAVLFNAGFFVTGVDGVATASVPLSAHRRGLDYSMRVHVLKALHEGKTSVGEVVIGLALKVPVFSMGTPIRDRAGRIVGSLVGVTNLTQANFLEKVSQHKLGLTGGYLLVSRPQRLIVSATDKSRAMEKLADPGVSPKIDKYLNGWEGYQVLVNPLGVEVLVAAHQLTNVEWYLAAATPTAEAFRPALDQQIRLLLMALVLTVLAGLVNWQVLKRQLSPVESTIRQLSALSESSGPVSPLPVHRRDEIGDLIESFNRLLVALEQRERERAKYEAVLSNAQRLEALGLLAGGIAHDFNNLLAAIFGSVELALLKDKDGPAAPYLNRTLSNLERARNLTGQLLTFSKGGDPELRVGPLFPFVEETINFALSGSAVVADIDHTADLWPCRFDRSQLGQVLDNLVINAIQAMGGKGSIRVRAENLAGDSPQVALTLEDSGPGVPPEVQGRLFEPFFTTKATGHGLGLTTCYSIVHKHGGTITLDSTPGRGARFRIVLPVAHECQAEPSAVDPPRPRGNTHVLVMDDDPEVGAVLEDLLVANGHTVVRTRSGEEALAAFREDREHGSQIGILFLDLTVPGGLGGIETLHLLRQVDATVPAVVVSGFSEAPVLANPTAHGFAAALRKPFSPSDLNAVLAQILNS